MSTTGKQIIRFATAQVEEQDHNPAPENVVNGRPNQTIRNIYTDPTGAFSTGTWKGDVGTVKIAYEEEEFCTLQTGKVKLTSETGEQVTLVPGDSFVIPAGFKGTWENVEPSSKVYVVYTALNA